MTCWRFLYDCRRLLNALKPSVNQDGNASRGEKKHSPEPSPKTHTHTLRSNQLNSPDFPTRQCFPTRYHCYWKYPPCVTDLHIVYMSENKKYTGSVQYCYLYVIKSISTLFLHGVGTPNKAQCAVLSLDLLCAPTEYLYDVWIFCQHFSCVVRIRARGLLKVDVYVS